MYLLIWPEDGIMRKDDVPSLYDGASTTRRGGIMRRREGRLTSTHVMSGSVIKSGNCYDFMQ